MESSSSVLVETETANSLSQGLHYVISSYPGRLASRRCVQTAAEVLHLHLGAILAVVEEKKRLGLPSCLGQITVMVTQCKPQHEPAYENFYAQEAWLAEFARRAPELPLVFFPYHGENLHYSYDQWLQGMLAFPAFGHHLVVEEDYAPHPSCPDFDILLLQEYEKVFPSGLGYLCLMEMDDDSNGRNAAIPHGIIGTATLELLAPDPLAAYYSLQGYPQLTFDKLFRQVAAERIAASKGANDSLPLISDMTDTFRAFFWDTPSASLVDLTAKSTRRTGTDNSVTISSGNSANSFANNSVTISTKVPIKDLKLGLVPVQLLDRELSSPCLPPKISLEATAALYRGRLCPLEDLALDIRGFLWQDLGLKAGDLVEGVAQGGHFAPHKTHDLIFCVLAHTRPFPPQGVLSGEERAEMTLAQLKALRERFPQAGIYLLDATQLTPGDMLRFGQYADWIFLLGKDERAMQAAAASKSDGECCSLLSFLSLGLKFRRLVKVTARYLPLEEVDELVSMPEDKAVFHLTPDYVCWSGNPAFCTVAYLIPWALREMFIVFLQNFLAQKIQPGIPTDIEHQMCYYFGGEPDKVKVLHKLGFLGVAANGIHFLV